MVDTIVEPADRADTIRDYWRACEARDWAGFAALLSPEVVYEVPQTRERVTGRDAYVRFNAEYPGDWHVIVHLVIGEGEHAASWARFVVDGTESPGLCFFGFDQAGLISQITDFWPEPYEPPADRAHLVQRY